MVESDSFGDAVVDVVDEGAIDGVVGCSVVGTIVVGANYVKVKAMKDQTLEMHTK